MDQILNWFCLLIERCPRISLVASWVNIPLTVYCIQTQYICHLIDNDFVGIPTHSIHSSALRPNIEKAFCFLGNILKNGCNVLDIIIINESIEMCISNDFYISFNSPFSLQYFFPDMKLLFTFLPVSDRLSQHVFWVASKVKNRHGLVVWHKSWHSSAVSDLTKPFLTFLSLENSTFIS